MSALQLFRPLCRRTVATGRSPCFIPLLMSRSLRFRNGNEGLRFKSGDESLKSELMSAVDKQTEQMIAQTSAENNADSTRKWKLLRSVIESKQTRTIVLQSEELGASVSQNTEVAQNVEEFQCESDFFANTPYFKLVNYTYPTLRYSLVLNGFKRVNTDDWNVFWGRPIQAQNIRSGNEFQRVNHFPLSINLGRKDNLHAHLMRMKRSFADDYDFFPHSYVLPNDTKQFQQEVARDPSRIMIAKPCAGSCGRGISLVRASDPTLLEKNCIVQDYIDKPLLINQFKFDLRLYVLVSSYDPLLVYLFDDGLVRFATQPYSLDDIGSRFSHLTNYSLNKNSDSFVHNMNASQDDVGSKWSLKALKRKFTEMQIPQEEMWKEVEYVIVKTLAAVAPKISNKLQEVDAHRNSCFELYGFDIMFDETLKPWLIEVNIMPSLHSSSPLDRKIKHEVLSQMFHLMGIAHYDRTNYDSERKRLLHYAKSSNGLTAAEKYILHDAEDELNRRGSFKRIFPFTEDDDDPQRFSHLFTKLRHHKLLVDFELEKQKCSSLSSLYQTIQ